MTHNIIQENNSSPRIQRNRQKRFQRILDGALALILEAGLDGLTMQKLAQRMDYAVGALYRYFDSKDTLLTEIQQQVLGAFLEVFQATDQAFTDPRPSANSPSIALARIILAAQIYYQLKQVAPTRFRLIGVIMGAPQSLLSLDQGLKVMSAAQPLLAHISHLIAQAQTAQALTSGDVQDRGLIFWASVQGLLQLEKLQRFDPQRFAIERLLRCQLDTLFLGWGAKEVLCQSAWDLVKVFQTEAAFAASFSAIQEEVLNK